MENHKAPTLKSTVLYWIAFTVALALVAVGLLNLGVFGGRPDSAAPEVVQSAPAATPEQSSPFVAEPVLKRVPTVSDLKVMDNFVLGTSNFTVSDFAIHQGCSVTDIGKAQSELRLLHWFRDLPAGFTEESFKTYVANSQLILSNTELVDAPSGPYFQADIRMVPIGVAYRSDSGLPTYLEVKAAHFTWMKVNDGHNNFDPLIRCDTQWT